MYYFSYAANLNRSHMAWLCPGAEPLFPAILEGYALIARGWFNVELQEGGEVWGGVWRILPEHMARLDDYEDCPGLYERRFLEVVPSERGTGGTWTRGREKLQCLIYAMTEPLEFSEMPPDTTYLELVRDGYRDWEISSRQLDVALEKISGN